MISGVDVVFIHSPDSNDSEWYQNVLGLKTTYNDGHWIEFQTPAGSSRLAIDIVSANPSPVERQPVIISLRVKDIQAAVHTLKERGVVFYNPQDPIFDVGPTLTASFQDPQGNWLQISQRKE